MKKFATLAIVGIIMALSAVSASAATETATEKPIISPQATVVVRPTTPTDADTDNNKPTPDDSNKSPQTGDFNATPYVVATLSMAAAAVACKAVKTSKEQ